MEISPALTARTSSGAASFWIFSIWPSVLLLMRAARASAWRDSSARPWAWDITTGLGPAPSPSASPPAWLAAVGTDSSPSARAPSSQGGVLRDCRISRLRSASTPRWKSDTLRRPRWFSIIQRYTSSMDLKLVFWRVSNGILCFLHSA